MEKEINMKKIISTTNAPTAIGPYSQGILIEKTLYCSGQIAIDPISQKLITGNIIDETNQVMQNILAVLESAKMDFSNVVKCSVFIKNMQDYNQINIVYAKYFHTNNPAREVIQVSGLPKDVNIEISVIAVSQ